MYGLFTCMKGEKLPHEPGEMASREYSCHIRHIWVMIGSISFCSTFKWLKTGSLYHWVGNVIPYSKFHCSGVAFGHVVGTGVLIESGGTEQELKGWGGVVGEKEVIYRGKLR